MSSTARNAMLGVRGAQRPRPSRDALPQSRSRGQLHRHDACNDQKHTAQQAVHDRSLVIKTWTRNKINVHRKLPPTITPLASSAVSHVQFTFRGSKKILPGEKISGAKRASTASFRSSRERAENTAHRDGPGQESILARVRITFGKGRNNLRQG